MKRPDAARPRVVFVNRFYLPDHSATAQMLAGVAGGLAADFAVTVITSRLRYDDPVARLVARERIGGVDIRRVWTTRFGRARLALRAIDYLTFYLSVARTLVWTLRRGDVIVAMTDPPLVALVCALPVRLRRARLVNWLQDVYPEIATVLGAAAVPGWIVESLAVLRDRSVRRADANVVLGGRMRDRLLARGAPEERLTIIPNWASPTLVVPKPATASALRTKLGLQGAQVAAYCGNLGHAHDFQTLLGAAALLTDLPDLRVLMVGGGAGMVQLRREVEARGWTQFLFLPYQPEEQLSDTLAAADVHLVCLKPELEGLILPSKTYGIMAAGRPAIYWGDLEGDVARELRHFDAGVAVQCGDSGGLATALRALLTDAGRRARLGENAREALIRNYTPERVVERWRTLLSSLDRPQ